jgi:penicillin-binding protein A
VELGADKLAQYSSAFGFGATPPWDLGGSQSRFPDPAGMDKAHVAQASFGQGEVLASPLEIAMAAAGVANGGTIMKPYVLDQVLDGRGNVLATTKPAAWLQPLKPEVAAVMRDLMVKVVSGGTGTSAALQGVQVAGKTGTAEVADAQPHAWFAGFAPAGAPKVAVAVLVENGGTGGAVAAPIARAVIAAALGR